MQSKIIGILHSQASNASIPDFTIRKGTTIEDGINEESKSPSKKQEKCITIEKPHFNFIPSETELEEIIWQTFGRIKEEKKLRNSTKII